MKKAQNGLTESSQIAAMKRNSIDPRLIGHRSSLGGNPAFTNASTNSRPFDQLNQSMDIKKVLGNTKDSLNTSGLNMQSHS